MSDYDKFLASATYYDDLGPVIGDDGLDGVGGYVYLGCLFIEDTTTWTTFVRPTKQWYLLLGRTDWDSDDLDELAERLYNWSVSEGYDVNEYI